MVVANGITSDTRVKKSALTAARLGCEVSVIGVGQRRRTESFMGEVRLIRIPVAWRLRERDRHCAICEGRNLGEELDLTHHRFRAKRIELETAIADIKLAFLADVGPHSPIKRATIRLKRKRAIKEIHRLRAEVSKADTDRHQRVDRLQQLLDSGVTEAAAESVSSDWKQSLPEMIDLEVAFAPELRALSPQLLHAHDFTALAVCVRYAKRAIAAGQSVKVVYDAHEYTRGISLPSMQRQLAYIELEDQHIRQCDAVVTVSPAIAERLEDDYQLGARPSVVLNAPISKLSADRSNNLGVRLRDVAAVPSDAPLVVFSGGARPERRVEVLVEALRFLPDVHLAIVSNNNVDLARVLKPAVEGRYDDRVHRADFVEPDLVPQYLSDADLGVHPLPRSSMNHEFALPNKLFEYLHARLPVVVSDVQSMSNFVTRFEVGKVYSDGDASSLAGAIRDALSDRERLRANITPELLSGVSWEAQEETLADRYRELLDRPLHLRTRVKFDFHEQPSRATASQAMRPSTTAPPGQDRNSVASILIGPRNMAGQGFAWAEALRAAGVDAQAFAFGREGTDLHFPCDRRVMMSDWKSLAWQVSQLRYVLSGRFSHVLLEAGYGIFGTLNGGTLGADRRPLEANGITVGAIFHGSELRDPDRHAESNRESPFHLMPSAELDRLRSRVQSVRRDIDDFSGPMFVSTIGLLEDLPEASWLPVLPSPEFSRTPRATTPKPSTPLVLHAPTSGPLKGSEAVDRICAKLADAGLIRYRRLGGIRHQELPSLFAEADLLIDGIRLGDYGVTACEAMSSGLCVLGHVSDSVRKHLDDGVPILETTEDSLESNIRTLVFDANLRVDLSHQGPHFVQNYHSREATIERLSKSLVGVP